MAMHIGMADLSVFRYARKSWYGVASAAGMYLGHFIAWIAASILYAVQLIGRPGQHRRAARAARLPRLRRRRPPLRLDRRLDHGQPHDLPRGPRLPGHLSRLLALQGHPGHRRRGHVRRHVPGGRHEAARLRGALRHGAHADGRRDLRGLLARRTARLRRPLCGALGHVVQLGRGPDVVADAWPPVRAWCSSATCRCSSSACPAGSWPWSSTRSSAVSSSRREPRPDAPPPEP